MKLAGVDAVRTCITYFGYGASTSRFGADKNLTPAAHAPPLSEGNVILLPRELDGGGTRAAQDAPIETVMRVVDGQPAGDDFYSLSFDSGGNRWGCMAVG